MTEAFSGSYPIESRGGEIERLHIQSAAMVPDTERMLELIGVREGWSCLDIGCGPGGIVGLLCKRVGSTGRVVGLDMNIGFLEHARATLLPTWSLWWLMRTARTCLQGRSISYICAL
jgi:Methylase involved in ubiquinone/menaquinone biosynthesis